MPLLALDLETTGLDPDHDAVLEVAAIVVPDDLAGEPQIWPTFRSIVMWDSLTHDHPVDPYVVAMHARNGLWAEALKSDRSTAMVDGELMAFMAANGCAGSGVQLCGNSVHFDRAFMRRCFPRAFAGLHHRQLDVSSINELARRCWPDMHANRPKGPEGDAGHRALADVYNSIATLRYYAGRMQDGNVCGRQ